MRVPASAAPPECAKERLGSRPPSFSVPGPPPARRPAISRPNSTACARRGAKKALGALAASILTSVYHMLISGELYRDLGPHHFDHRSKALNTGRLVVRLHNPGYAVQITPLAA